MLQIQHLTKTYGDKKAVDDLNLHIVDPVDPENPDKPDQPDTPTGIESIEEGMSLYTANQSIFVNMPQQVALKVVDVSGIVLYEGSILGKAEIPVGHAGVYFVRCEAFGDSFVRKVVVR